MTDSKPSKTERKRAHKVLQQLGERLIGLDDELLASLDLEERLSDAIRDARRFKSREALRRHKQYIGKLMRDIDPAPILDLFTKLDARDRRQKRVFAQAERWRDRLLSDGNTAADAFCEQMGGRDEQLYELLAAVQQAGSDRQERTLSRRLFRHVHAALAARAADR